MEFTASPKSRHSQDSSYYFVRSQSCFLATLQRLPVLYQFILGFKNLPSTVIGTNEIVSCMLQKLV